MALNKILPLPPLLHFLNNLNMLKPSSFSCSDAISWTNNNWPIPIISSILYLALIYFGKQWMKNREPFDLKGPLFMWNASKAILSVIGASVCVPALISSVREKGFVYTSCTSDGFYESDNSVICFWIFLLVVSKVMELGDTFFIVLRKKPLIFLHWYHQVSILYLSWFVFSMSATGIAHWSSSLHYTIHSIMYSYYAATSVSIRFPVIVPSFITMLQLVQMIIGTTVNLIAFAHRSSCPVDSAAALSGAIILISYAVLFGEYFIRRYVLGKKKRQ